MEKRDRAGGGYWTVGLVDREREERIWAETEKEHLRKGVEDVKGPIMDSLAIT